MGSRSANRADNLITDTIARLTVALEGRYRIERELGEGGMAKVFLADDLRHDRRVALKVLKAELAAVLGAERFLTEIKTTAALQHPHILPLHDSGEADGLLYYVMPYVEGESLRSRLDRERQLPVDEAVHIATAVANGLDYAHRHGVVHRDVKPANILLQDGEPVVSDFGIALAWGAAGGPRLTETGFSLGTPHYMSPEQATGDQAVGPATDIYALACVLYEMLAGEPPFSGGTPQAILGRIITGGPEPVTAQRKSVPANVEAAINKALERLPADRFKTISGFADALTDPGFSTSPGIAVTPGVAKSRKTPRWRRAVHLTLTVALALAVVAMALARSTGDSASGGSRVEFTVRSAESLSNEVIALTPDGRRLVIGVDDGSGHGALKVRDLERAGLRPLADGSRPFVSPDGQWVAFVHATEGELRRVPIEGGTPVFVAPDITVFLGGSWGPDGTIVYVPNVSAGLWAVSIDGGTPRQLTVPDRAAGELGHWAPQFLPGGQRVLFSKYRPPLDSASIEVLDRETGTRRPVLRNGQHGRYLPTGHLVFMRRETMWAAPFDLDRLALSASPRPVLEGIAYGELSARGAFAVSDNGTLAYVRAEDWNNDNSLVWVRRDGAEEPALPEWSAYARPRLSPDGTKVAVEQTVGGETDIWVHDLERGGSRRVTRDVGLVRNPHWAGDEDIVYSRERPQLDVYRRHWEATDAAVELLTSPLDKQPSSVSPDGTVLAYMVTGDDRDIWVASLNGEFEARPFRDTEHNEQTAVFSPDGRWIAHTSDESGTVEIWLAPYPGTDGVRRRRQITSGGGTSPKWGAAGELFFRHGEGIRSVRIDLATGQPDAPVDEITGPYLFGDGNWDFAVDRQRFLIVKPRPGVQRRREVTLVLNWLEDLMRLVPD